MVDRTIRNITRTVTSPEANTSLEIEDSTGSAQVTRENFVAGLASSVTIDHQTFVAASGTWTKPAGAISATVRCIGGGQGGNGGGRNGANLARDGGTGGEAGKAVIQSFAAADLGSTEAIVVGQGSTGGNGATIDAGVATTASGGGDTTFGGTKVTAPGGVNGIGAGAFQGALGQKSNSQYWKMFGFGMASSVGGIALPHAIDAFPSGGGGGASTDTSNNPDNGGRGGSPTQANWAAGGTSGTPTGGNATVPGGGGGGAYASGSGAGVAGGNGLAPGGGGGGGSPGTSANGGKGGTGAAGQVDVWTICAVSPNPGYVKASTGEMQTGTEDTHFTTPAKVKDGVQYNGGRPYFSASSNIAQSCNGSAYTKCPMNLENDDSDACYDNVTNYRFTPNVAGRYLVYGLVALESMNNGVFAGCAIYKNGALERFARTYGSVTGAFPGGAVSTIVNMNGSTDYVELYVWNGEISTARVLNVAGPTTVGFGAHRIST